MEKLTESNIKENIKQLSLLEEKIEDFRPIHYLGSKLRMLNFIKDNIDKLDPTQGRVCDLFAGSGTVSKYLSKFRPVTSVDIQEYSRVICSSLLNQPDKNLLNIDRFISDCIESNHYKNLLWAIDPMIIYEKKCIQMALDGEPKELCELIENGSIIRYEEGYLKEVSKDLKDSLECTNNRLKEINLIRNSKAQIVRYFGGIYFSYLQSIQMDAILEEVYNQDLSFRDTLISAVLSTASEIVNTVGKQFAQPMKAFDKEGKPKKNIVNKVNKDRNEPVFDIFKISIDKYLNQEKSKFENKAYRMDYLDALDILDNDIKVVYADPPYTRYHYSRYYHVLETICLRDNPKITKTTIKGIEDISRGIYREDRHQSPFSIKTQVSEAFDKMFKKVKELGADLILSYSPFDENKKEAPRLKSIDELQDMAKQYFTSVEVISVGEFYHSKLNRSDKNSEISYEAEILIICKQ
ncbi:DNA adenine methylase [Paraclostridium sordellii]|uniref:DNA adenine methylase n=1 Tax=Paraclostridium sordellii TaxID=1505 RepID=UPI000C767448|nr:DNA adenine methylase [Paeniclostridium sordellii]